MDKTTVLMRLAEDAPLFHHVSEEGARRCATLAGITVQPGDCSWAVTPRVLQWIADHLSGEMVTIETGAGYTTVLFTATAKHHYCCTNSQREEEKIRAYLDRIGVPNDKLTFLIGSTDETLPRLDVETLVDFAYIDGCHGYPFPALDWHYMDKHLKVGGMIGMDNAELRPVREHCEFLEENGTYQLVGVVLEHVFVRFYRKLMDENREWINQDYSRRKRDDQRLLTQVRRKASKLIKPHLY